MGQSKGTEESTLEMDSSVPLTRHDPKDFGLICLVKKHKIHFRILSDLRIQSWIFLKKRILTLQFYKPRDSIVSAEDQKLTSTEYNIQTEYSGNSVKPF